MKTFGAIDKVFHRKPRSDRGKKRKKYKGKPVKNKKKRHYRKRIGNKQYIKIRPVWRTPMSVDGYSNWKPHLRSIVYKEISNMKMSPVFEVDVSEIDTKEKIEDFVARNKWGGKFVVMGISSARTKTHRKWVNMCTILVKETPEGNVGRMIQNKRLFRYWFYRS